MSGEVQDQPLDPDDAIELIAICRATAFIFYIAELRASTMYAGVVSSAAAI